MNHAFIHRFLLTLCLLALPSFAFSDSNQDSLKFNEQGVAALKGKDLVRAEELFRRAVQVDEGNLTAVYNLAGALLTNKKVVEAINLLQSYSKKSVSDPGILFRLGEAQFANKNIRAATEAFERASALDPHYPMVHARLGTLYSLGNRLKEAEASFLLAVEQAPNDSASLSSLAAISLANGKPDQSLRVARRAIQIKPNVELYITLGSAHEHLKSPKEALIAYRRALNLAPNRKDLQEKITELEEAEKQQG